MEKLKPKCTLKNSGLNSQEPYKCEKELPPKDFNDPWKHRSTIMKCNTCMHSMIKENNKIGLPIPIVGRCRRHAPTMNGYPVIFIYTDWCGDHKLDENKAY